MTQDHLYQLTYRYCEVMEYDAPLQQLIIQRVMSATLDAHGMKHRDKVMLAVTRLEHTVDQLIDTITHLKAAGQ